MNLTTIDAKAIQLAAAPSSSHQAAIVCRIDHYCENHHHFFQSTEIFQDVQELILCYQGGGFLS